MDSDVLCPPGIAAFRRTKARRRRKADKRRREAHTRGGNGCGLKHPREGKTRKSDSLAALEKETPAFNPDSGEWVKNKAAAKTEGLTSRTLATYRSAGIKSKTIGKDKDGRVWRRPGTPRSHPWYLKSALILRKSSPKNRQ